MKISSVLVPGALAIALAAGAPSAAQAAGCVKGAIVGGIVGHLAGNHGMLGAGAGCLIGGHAGRNNERDRARREDEAQYREYNDGRSFEEENRYRR